jgi:hypothetical protein
MQLLHRERREKRHDVLLQAADLRLRHLSLMLRAYRKGRVNRVVQKTRPNQKLPTHECMTPQSNIKFRILIVHDK